MIGFAKHQVSAEFGCQALDVGGCLTPLLVVVVVVVYVWRGYNAAKLKALVMSEISEVFKGH